MVNPLLTILFDLFLIGSALAIAAAMATEYFLLREPHVGGARKARPAAPASPRRRATVHRIPAQRRRAA